MFKTEMQMCVVLSLPSFFDIYNIREFKIFRNVSDKFRKFLFEKMNFEKRCQLPGLTNEEMTIHRDPSK